ncbi:MAG: BatA domain-containing protein [Bacteroidota bacterium]
MEFLYPNFLYALAALAIPIIIHLFNFRRFKKVPFTNVRFLREIKIQTQSQNKLRHLLVLLMRLLALAFLVLAFAQPFIPSNESENKDTGKAVSIFIDNSFSMNGENEDGPLLEVAKNRAIEIAMAFEPTDRFQLLSQGFLGENQRFISRTEFIDNVSQLDLASKSRSLKSVLERQKDLISGTDASLGREAFIISDFQVSQFKLEEFSADTSINYSLVKLERGSPSNLYIDSVWFDTPVRRIGQNERLSVRIVNTGNDDIENVPLTLSINGKQKALGSFAVNSRSSVDTALTYLHENAGLKKATVSIDDYPIDYDDDYHIGYDVSDDLKILSISNTFNEAGTSYLNSVYGADSSYSYQALSLSDLNYGNLQYNDLIILNELESVPGGLRQELRSFAENGGSIWVIPSDKADLDNYNLLLLDLKAGGILNAVEEESKVRSINGESSIYRDIFESVPRNLDLPVAQKYYPLVSSLKSTEEPLLQMQGGKSFLSAYSENGGKVYVQAVPLTAEENNFSRHAIFVATALRIAELSGNTDILTAQIGEEARFDIAYFKVKNEDVFHLNLVSEEIDIVPAYQVAEGRISFYSGPELDFAGTYDLTLGDSSIAAVGFNYERKESDLESYSNEELEEGISNLGVTKVSFFSGDTEAISKQVRQKVTDTELWKICLILALVFLLLESVILRFGKRSIS